ncbi:stage II sporulation protein E [Clostridium sp. JN-9]|uniref:stage II sporulation protein E n=1 Tax=Clostridium sp. JN-9 TaxID=2507159 RepID=UPI000FFE12C1|nr:stage II sporulation protein E [Clostridium sp. JN-9]QAT41445.1 stage II sporulation protein E [Clostridium sp. JN-9]
MQYGAEIFPYKRTSSLNNQKSKGKNIDKSIILAYAFYFVGAFLTSRVLLINLMAPFGVAFLIAIITRRKGIESIVAGCGALIGYASIYSSGKNIEVYFIICGALVALEYALVKSNKKVKLISSFLTIFIIFNVYKLTINGLGFGTSFLTSFFETASIFPIYYIINYSIICFSEFKTRHLFSNEEIISMTITSALIMAGTWGFNLFGVSIRNIIALCFVLIIGNTKGSTAAAASGVAVGTIMGISSSNMVTFVGVYGLCGLISGIFKETGKWICGISYMIAFTILKLYSSIGVQFKIAEVVICCIIFFLIPIKILHMLESEINCEIKVENQSENYVVKLKDMLSDKLVQFSDVLVNVSSVLRKLSDNDKLSMKSKSSGLIDNVADRVCSNCNMRSICWKREAYYTYSAVGDLIRNYQDNNKTMPGQLERKCIRKDSMIKNTEEIVNKYVINEMWRKRLGQSRELLSVQIDNIADSVSEIISGFNDNITIDSEIENNIRRILNKNKIIYKDVFCFYNKIHKLVVQVSIEACGGKQICIKSILPLINTVTGRCMCTRDDGCQIDKHTNNCKINFEETPKFHIASYVSRVAKDGEKYNGDSYKFEKINNGEYITMLSDGMGSGPTAGKESSAAVDLVTKFVKAEFKTTSAINIVNSIMSIKFSEEEKFSTVDLSNINLYNGEISFLKVGAVASFIKKGRNVDIIKSKTLPIGVLDKPDVDIINKKVENGDIIVMLSDGVLDYDSSSIGKVDWIVEYLKSTNLINPNEISNEIITKAKELSGGKVKDDMTVVVEKVYSLYE